MVASAGFHGPLAPSLSGVADTRRQPTQKAVKRKSQATRTIALEFAYRFPERLHTVTTAERRTGTG